MAGNDDLHPILSNIHSTLGDVLKSIKKVRSEVKKVKEAVTEGTERIIKAIDDSVRAQAEMKMMERVAEVREIKPQITAEQERVMTEQDELDRQLQRIAERYERKHEELDEKAANRIRDLGSHIFEIDEDEFENGIEEPFVDHVTTAWRTLQAQNDTVGRQRRERVESKTGEIVTEIHDFVDQQNELVDRIRRTRTELERSLSEPRTIQIPYYVVTVERDGQTEQHVVAPSRTESADGPVSVSLESLPGMDRLASRTDLDHTQIEAVNGHTVGQELDQYIDDDRPLLSYDGLVEETVGDQVEIAIEGGS